MLGERDRRRPEGSSLWLTSPLTCPGLEAMSCMPFLGDELASERDTSLMRGVRVLKGAARTALSAWRIDARQATQAAASAESKLGFLTPPQPGTVNEFGHHVFIRGAVSREATEHPAWPDVVERHGPQL